MDWGETEDYVINIGSTVGLNELSASNFIIYPNPVTNSLTLNNQVSSTSTYKVVNLSGQEVQSGIVTNAYKKINVSSLLDGVYFLQIYNDHQFLGQEKFVKNQK